MKRLTTAKTEFVAPTAIAVHASSPPFMETFDTLDDGTLNAQNGWMLHEGTAVVQTNTVHSGKASELTEATITRNLSTTNEAVWITFWADCTDLADPHPAEAPANTNAAFYISANQNVVVYSNHTAVTLPTIIPTNIWTRFDVHCDCSTLTWNLSVNKTNIVAGLPLSSDNQQIASVRFDAAAPIHIDELLTIVHIEPATDLPDSDLETLPDWWEQKYFGGIAAADPNDPAANGINTLQEAYLAGQDPFGMERFEIAGAWIPVPALHRIGHPGRYYSIYGSPTLTTGFELLQNEIPWDQNSFIDTTNTNAPQVSIDVGLWREEENQNEPFNIQTGLRGDARPHRNNSLRCSFLFPAR